MAQSASSLSGDGWLESSQWLARARRLGPLPYSELGSRRLDPPRPGDIAALAGWISRTADGWWDAAGRPDPYTLVVVSGDEGHLARSVLGAGPRCVRALRYVLVNPDHRGRSGPPPGLARLVDLEEPAFLYPAAPSPATPGTGVDAESTDDELDVAERPPARGIGPLATFLTEVPVLGETPGAVIALDALSRLPYELYEKVDAGWCEVRVAASGQDLVEIHVPGDGPPPPPSLPAAAVRWRRLTGAAAWLRRTLPTAEAGPLAVVDGWSRPGDTDSLDVGQLGHVREPVDTDPQPVEGTSRAVVTWRLG